MRTKAKSTPRQLTIFTRGGGDRGAGRKPNASRPLVSHAARPRLTRHQPVLVTVRLRPGLPNLRDERTGARVRDALAAGSDRFGFRLVEYSIQRDHLHFIAEADDRRALARGMQGLMVRIARGLNRAWERRGTVFRDRYHAGVLETPKHVRSALVYVLQNARKHREIAAGIDPLSSGPAFRGWADGMSTGASTVARPTAWLLTTGWRRWGLLSRQERPALTPPWA